MNNKNTSIHDFDFALICGYFSKPERQAPGSPEITVKALSFIENITENSVIADIGCGTDRRTMVLTQNLPGKITGIDLFPHFLKKLRTDLIKINITHLFILIPIFFASTNNR